MPTKVDTDATDAVMSLNDNEQEPGCINKDTDVTDDQEPREFFTNNNVTDADTDADMGLNYYAIFKKMLLLEPKMIPKYWLQ